MIERCNALCGSTIHNCQARSPYKLECNATDLHSSLYGLRHLLNLLSELRGMGMEILPVKGAKTRMSGLGYQVLKEPRTAFQPNRGLHLQ